MKYYTTASKIKNFISNDKISDFLMCEKSSFTRFLLNKGIEFEDGIIKYINENIIRTKKVGTLINQENHDKTIKYMKQGIPVIYSAPFVDDKNKTKGIIDLLVRNDYLHKLTEITPPCDKSKSSFGKFHYVVIDIKFL